MTKSKPFSVGAFLRMVRKNRGWSQSDLANKTGLRPSAISHFESGRREPSIKNLIKLCDALNCSSDTLLGRGVL